MMFVAIASVIALVIIGGLISAYAYMAYRDRKIKENAIKNVRGYQNKIIKNEIETLAMSLNGKDPYSAEYKKIQEEIDKDWEESRQMLEKTKKYT